MSTNIWDNSEPFRDGAPVYENGTWKEQETYTPAPDNVLAAAKANKALIVQQQEDNEYDVEETVQETENEEEEEEDFTEVLSDARLRLEQGKLYEQIMNHDLFSNVDADPRAAKSVQKQIRNWAKTQMEIMLGMRQEPTTVSGVVSSPFNNLEVEILKNLASAATNGATQSEEAQKEGLQAPPKKKTFNPITTVNPKTKAVPKPIQKKAEPIQRAKPVKQGVEGLEYLKKRLQEEENKPKVLNGKELHEMNAQERAKYLKEVNERNNSRAQVIPADRAPMPDFDTQYMIAASQAARATNGASGAAAFQGKLSSLIINNQIKKV